MIIVTSLSHRFHWGRDEDTEQTLLLDGIKAGLHLADVLTLVLHSHPGDGEVVTLEHEPGVLPDDDLPRRDESVVDLPDHCPWPNVSNLEINIYIDINKDKCPSPS